MDAYRSIPGCMDESQYLRPNTQVAHLAMQALETKALGILQSLADDMELHMQTSLQRHDFLRVAVDRGATDWAQIIARFFLENLDRTKS